MGSIYLPQVWFGGRVIKESAVMQLQAAGRDLLLTGININISFTIFQIFLSLCSVNEEVWGTSGF